ncbi:MAG: hypothetical protein IJ769_00770 [Clostridia bacterium]|nr:hypothetical protein [Clostridia bacterium]
MALLLPRDMPAMHQRMTDRENAEKGAKFAAAVARACGNMIEMLGVKA